MTIDPRVALNALTNALEEHLSASLNRRGDEDPAVESAFYTVADAFEAYEDSLFARTGEVTPLDLYDEDAVDDDNDHYDDDGNDQDAHNYEAERTEDEPHDAVVDADDS